MSLTTGADQNLLRKLSTYKKHMLDADKAAEIGLSSESAITGGVTDSMRDELTKVADQIAQTLGVKSSPVSQPGKSQPAAGKKKSGKKKKSGGDAFADQ